MAEVEKHTDGAMIMLMKHNERQLTNDSNKDIITERTQLNYSIPLDHGGLTDRDYYKKIVNDSYLYGRGSRREADAITSFSWVVTLPKEISDYTTADKEILTYLNPEQEKAFFDGALNFVSERYGAENVVHNKIHYDEAGQPHIHIYVVPRKELDHDQVHFKINRKSKKAVKTESGRWEYQYKYKLDGNGARIEVKNYAKMSDYYDTKLSCMEIINPIELKHFHPDFAEYLRKNNLPGADAVHTGVTGGKNISVKSMKEFTKNTGMTIDQVKQLDLEKEGLQGRVSELEKDVKDLHSDIYEKNTAIKDLKQQLYDTKVAFNRSAEMAATKDVLEGQLSAKEKEVTHLTSRLASKEAELSTTNMNYEEIKTRYAEAEKTISAYQAELNRTRNTVKALQQNRELEASNSAAKDRTVELLTSKLAAKEAELSSTNKNYEELQTRYVQAENTISAYKEELNRTRNAVKELQQDRTFNANDSAAKDREILALQRKVASLKDQVKEIQHEKDIALAAKDREIEQLKDKEIAKEPAKEWGTSGGWGQQKGWNAERSNTTWEQESTWDK